MNFLERRRQAKALYDGTLVRATGTAITADSRPEYFVQGLGITDWDKSMAYKMNDDKTMFVHSTIFKDDLPEAFQDDRDHYPNGEIPPLVLENHWESRCLTQDVYLQAQLLKYDPAGFVKALVVFQEIETERYAVFFRWNELLPSVAGPTTKQELINQKHRDRFYSSIERRDLAVTLRPVHVETILRILDSSPLHKGVVRPILPYFLRGYEDREGINSWFETNIVPEYELDDLMIKLKPMDQCAELKICKRLFQPNINIKNRFLIVHYFAGEESAALCSGFFRWKKMFPTPDLADPRVQAAKARLKAYESRKRAQLQSYQPAIEGMVKELATNYATPDTKDHFDSFADWTRNCHERPNLDTQMQLGTILHACASKLERTRQEASVGSATADQLASALKENESMKEQILTENAALCRGFFRWKHAMGAMRAAKSARELLRGEAEDANKRTKSRNKKKKKKQTKMGSVDDDEPLPLPSICEDTVACDLAELNSGDLERMRALDGEGEQSSVRPPVASSSVASALACVVCFHRASEYALIPCGHRCLCCECYGSFEREDAACPMCRKPAVMVVKIFG